MEVVTLQKKFALFHDHWHPRIIASCNDHDVKIAKVKGEFVWHDHTHEDELFMVIKGCLEIHFADHIQEIHEGELIVVPKGITHKPVATEECWILLFEPRETKHTGDIVSELTKTQIDRI